MIHVLVPSRGRSARAAAMVASIEETAAGPVNVTVIIDPDEPDLMGYTSRFPGQSHAVSLVTLGDRIGFTGSLNRVAATLWDDDVILGAFGDDVIFRTPGWDRVVEQVLATPGIAYGDDLIHGERHPTAVFMSSVVARALEWLALPATTHQWADDAWKRLGQETGLLRFMPSVVIEHMHPGVGKAEWDDTYREVFDDAKAKGDYDGYTAWVGDGGLNADVQRVVDSLGVTT